MEAIGYAEHKEKDKECQKISLEIDDFAKIFRIYMDEYDVFRKYLTREEDLINQRLGWILLCEGFLFGANAAVTKFLFDMIQNPSVQHKNVYIILCLLILLSMSILGCLAAFWCLKSVRAAHNAMKKLFKLWGIRQANWKKIFSGMNIKHCSRLSSFDFELPFAEEEEIRKTLMPA